MKLKTFTLRTNLLSKLLLAAAMMIGGGSSAWGDSFLTVNDYTSATTNYFPFYGSKASTLPLGSQYIIPKEDISAIKGNNITKIVLYFSGANLSWGDARFKVYFKELDNATFTPATPESLVEDGLIEVFSGELSVNSDKKMEITLSGSGYAYNGNNLLVSFNATATGLTTGLSCYGKSNTGTAGAFANIAYSYYAKNYSTGSYQTYIYGQKFLPKMTLYYSTSATPAPTSFSISSQTYNTATLGWTPGGAETKWQIKYDEDPDFDPDTEGNMVVDNPVDVNPYVVSDLDPETTYYAYIRAFIDAENQSRWVGPVSFTTYEQYPTPTDFIKTGVTATTATFSWSNGLGTEATKWIIKYSTTQGFNPDETGTSVAVDENPYTLENLVEGTYYARICADYGSSHYSSWNPTEIEFTPSNFVNILVNNGTDKSYNIPIAGSSVSANENSMVKGQFVIPASSLSSMSNRQITQLTFYAENSSVSWGTATFEVYLNEVSYTTFSSTSFGSWGTNVYNSASLSISSNQMSIILDTPFNYTGGNLQVGFKQTSKGSSNSASWLSVRDGGYANLAIYGTGTGSTGTRTYYAPKVTITSVPVATAPVKIDGNGVTTFASPWALDLTAATQSSLGLTAYKASVDAGNSKVLFTSGIDQNVSANTGLLLSGTPNETYLIPVAESGTALADNALLVNDGTLVAESGYTYYALKKNSDPLVFGTFDPSTVVIPSNKAYVKVATGGGVKEFTCEFENATAVQGIKEAQPAVKGAVYDLSGRRVAQPKRGLYIIDGKKVVIK